VKRNSDSTVGIRRRTQTALFCIAGCGTFANIGPSAPMSKMSVVLDCFRLPVHATCICPISAHRRGCAGHAFVKASDLARDGVLVEEEEGREGLADTVEGPGLPLGALGRPALGRCHIVLRFPQCRHPPSPGASVGRLPSADVRTAPSPARVEYTEVLAAAMAIIRAARRLRLAWTEMPRLARRRERAHDGATGAGVRGPRR